MTNTADEIMICFSEKIRLGISCELSAGQTIHMKCKPYFLRQTIHMKHQALFSLRKLEFCYNFACLLGALS